MTPDLTDAEVDQICAGLVQNAAKIRYLKALGLRVERRPNGRPLVARAEWDRRTTGASEKSKSANGPKWTVAA